MTPVTVTEVHGGRETTAFLKFPHALNVDDPHWIAPLLFEQRLRLDRDKNPYFQHAEAVYFIARRDGDIVGTVSAQICELAKKHHGNGVGHFGFFECVDDVEVARALIAAARGWLATRGATRMVGPLNLSINDEAGVLVDGFDRPPFVFMGHHGPYYDRLLKQIGLKPAIDLYAYYMNLNDPYDDRLRRIIQRTRQAANIRIEHIPRRKIATELAPVLRLFNDAWSDNWGHVPLTSEEVDHLVRSVTTLLDDDSVIVATIDDEVAGFIVAIPNLCQWTSDLGGRLFPTGWARLLWRMKFGTSESIRVPLMGVRKDLQSSRTGANVALAMIDHCKTRYQQRGVVRAEMSWILETNTPMRSILHALGATNDKTYRMYQCDFDG